MKQIYPIIMDTSFNKLAVIDDYQSLIWTTRYYTSGDFELVTEVNEKNISLLKPDYYVMRDDDENVGMIEDIVIQRSKEGAEQIIVSGRFLAGAILSRRIIYPQTTVSGTVSNCINTLINKNIISPSTDEYISAENRKIPNFVLGSYNISGAVNAQYTGDNLLDVIEKICETNKTGFKVTLNSNNQFVFQLYQGVDRTYDQSVNPWVIFSDKYDNLESSVYEEDYTKMHTAAWIAGEGEGLDRLSTWCVTSPWEGLDRREIYVDRRDVKKNDMSEVMYYLILSWEGSADLGLPISAFSGVVYFDNIKYREDVNIGDLVVIQNDRWGVHVNTRLVEVIESVSEAGMYSIVPTFGI